MTEKAPGLQMDKPMKRITAVFVAAALAIGAVGCGLGPNETIDEHGNVVQLGQSENALISPDTTTPGGLPGDITPLPPLVFSGPSTNPTIANTGGIVDPTIALPQDPIPLLNPSKVGPPGPNSPGVK